MFNWLPFVVRRLQGKVIKLFAYPFKNTKFPAIYNQMFTRQSRSGFQEVPSSIPAAGIG